MQSRAPKFDLLLESLHRELFSLPRGKIAVLDSQFGKIGPHAINRGVVRFC